MKPSIVRVFLATVVLGGIATANSQTAVQRETIEWCNLRWDNTNDQKLPRVLLIGDSISIGYTVPVRGLLAGKANVHRVPENCQSTVYALLHIREWLGDGKWDVIHFDWGIWDAHHTEDGSLRTTPEQYEKNLRQLVAILKTTGATLSEAAKTLREAGASSVCAYALAPSV